MFVHFVRPETVAYNRDNGRKKITSGLNKIVLSSKRLPARQFSGLLHIYVTQRQRQNAILLEQHCVRTGHPFCLLFFTYSYLTKIFLPFLTIITNELSVRMHRHVFLQLPSIRIWFGAMYASEVLSLQGSKII